MHDVESPHLEFEVLLVGLALLQILQVLDVGLLAEQERQAALFHLCACSDLDTHLALLARLRGELWYRSLGRLTRVLVEHSPPDLGLDEHPHLLS